MRVSCTRRQFLKVFAVGAVTSSLAGKKLVQTYASEALATANPGTFKVTFTEYPVLRNDFSSIRLSVNPMLGDFPWVLAPAAAIFVVVLAVNLIVQSPLSASGAVSGASATR